MGELSLNSQILSSTFRILKVFTLHILISQILRKNKMKMYLKIRLISKIIHLKLCNKKNNRLIVNILKISMIKDNK